MVVNKDVEEGLSPQQKEFVTDKKILIIEETSTLRMTIKQLLLSLEIPNSAIEYAENFDIGVEKIDSVMPHIVFCSHRFSTTPERTGFDLFAQHDKNFPNRSEVIFLLISSEKNLTISSKVVDSDIDGVVYKPIAVGQLKDNLLDILDFKTQDAVYYQSLQKARELIYSGNIKAALQEIETSLELSQKPVMSYFFLGKAHEHSNNTSEAEKSFKEGLKHDPLHYRCLSGLFDLYSKENKFAPLVTYGQKLYQNYPFNPDRIPALMKGLVVTKQYQLIIDFAESLKDEPDIAPNLQKNLAAGLAIAGKILLREAKLDEGIEILKTAAQMSGKFIKIFSSIIRIMLEHKLIKYIPPLLPLVDEEIRQNSPQYKELEFEVMANSSKLAPLQIVKLGMDLLNNNIETPLIYRYLIEKSIAGKRKQDLIDDLIFKAKKKFPDQQDIFNKYIKS